MDFRRCAADQFTVYKKGEARPYRDPNSLDYSGPDWIGNLPCANGNVHYNFVKPPEKRAPKSGRLSCCVFIYILLY